MDFMYEVVVSVSLPRSLKSTNNVGISMEAATHTKYNSHLINMCVLVYFTFPLEARLAGFVPL